MNKNLYRIVFNKARGMLMVVGELATSAHGTASPSSAPYQMLPCRICKLSRLQLALLLALGCVSLAANAAVVADGQAPGNQQPTIISSANGTPQINIQTPSSGGVSRNLYSQFDVDNKGVVLNNSHANTQTQIAGMISGNGNLARGEAKVILNEVNARNASQLNGMIEVAGQNAQVVIANPAGITCNGCGFINAHRATLTTGQVQMNNGLITGYEVNSGEIVIQGAGMDSSRQDRTDLIARAVKVNAGIWANELNVTAGRNTVDADHQLVTARTADDSTAPALAIDVAALGGMYANKIRLLGTEHGVGVHNAGNIGAAAGDVVVNADGSISNSGSINASQNLQLTTQRQLENSGKIYAAGNTDATAKGLLSNSGIIAAGNNTTLNAATLTSDSTAALAAGMNSDGTLGSAGNLTLNSQGELKVNGQAAAANQLAATGTTLDFSGSQTFGNDITLQATSGSLNTSNATLAATRQLSASARTAINNDGGKISAETLNLKGDSLSSQQGLIQQLGTDNLQLSFTDGLNMSGGSLLTNSKLDLAGGQLVLDDATVQANQLSITADSLSHRRGNTVQTGSGDLSVTVSGLLDNQQGRMTTNGNLQLTAASLNNQQGSLIAAQNGALLIKTQEPLNNQQGVMAAAGNLSLYSTGLNNAGGLLQSSADMTLALADGDLNNRDSGSNGGILSQGALTIESGDIDNTAGFIGAGGHISLTGLNLINQQGTLSSNAGLNLTTYALNNQSGWVQAGTDLNLDTLGNSLDNTSGVVSAGQSLTLLTGALNNQSGDVQAGSDLNLNTLDNSLDNTSGVLSAGQSLTLLTGALNNQSGHVQAGSDLSLNTHGNTLNNISGVVSAGKTLTLLTGALLNASGQLISSGRLLLNTQGQLLDNSSGTIAASGDAQLDSGTLSNSGGQIQIVGNASINAAGASLDNTSGLIRGGQSLSLTSNQLINHDTLSENTGIEGQSVTLTSAIIDNSDGAIRANDLLDITSSHTLNNSNGLFSSASQLNINGGNSLAFTNTTGTLIGGSALNLSAFSLSGDGRVLSQNVMTLVLQQAFFNQGQVIANGDMNFSTANELVNQSLIQAGGVLNLQAAELDNQQSGEISAEDNHLLISGNVTNRGLLDGGLTHISSATLTNSGTGRLYGDHIALQTGTLHNLAENGTAATIAARDQLDIGAGVINNADHGLIYSAGDLAIGGALDENWRASGKASVFNNHSATLESAGTMTLDIGEINNINDHLVTEMVVVEQSSHHEVVLSGATTRYDWDDVDTSTSNKYGVHDAIMPDGTRDNNFYEYQYERTITETQVIESDPGQIMAGGNLTINSAQVNNHDSRIVAGGLLSGVIGELNNIATMGERVISDIGTQIRWYAKKKSGGAFGGTKTSQGKDYSDYQPDDIIQTIDLQTLAWQGNTAISSSGTTIGERDATGITVNIIHASDITADTSQIPLTPPPGQRVEIVPPDSDDNTVIRMITPDTTLPDNSLYQLHPDSDVSFLIETDPRFTNNKQWLGSDYMQTQFTQDPNNVLKRLGDGFYEQQLIRQQVVALTGNRFLNGYSSDEEQFKALMDNGIAFGKAFNLTIGVALTAQQMSLLTSDMVWLVKQTVTLPDGTTQEVLVPQLYARVKSGDLDGSGALLTGNNISLNISNDLTNSGNISGREVTQLTAENLNNSGFIGGDSVSLLARSDINNIGGTLQGNSSLTAVAGRDINSISTLGGSPDNITFDRLAGIYVQNDNGALALQALNNINLTATQISNNGEGGQTQIIAGNDLNLNTVTTTLSENGDWGNGNDRSLTQSTDIGSQITGNGDVVLAAGHDLNARAATVSAEDSLSVIAGNDLNITSGSASYHLTENSHQTSGGLLSRKSVTTHDEVQSQSAVSSNFDGDSVTLQAGHDLNIIGSNVAGTHDVALAAGNDLTITTAEETRQETHLRKEKKSGLSGTGGIGVTAGTSRLKVTDDASSLSSLGSTVGSSQGNVSLSAGNGLTVKGSDLLAGNDLSLTGSEVNILAAENQSSQNHRVEQKQSGLTLALSGTAGSALNTAVSSARDAGKESSGRLAALQGMKAALNGVSASQAVRLDEAAGNSTTNNNTAGLSLSYGSQSSKSQSAYTANTQQGSTLTAGNNLSITATGNGTKGQDGDINVQGSQLQAGNDLLLSANRDVNLFSAQESDSTRSTNSSKGASAGVGIGIGSGGWGGSVSASVNSAKGHENADSLSHVETQVSAGNQVTIVSGRDTTLTGAQVTGDTVKASVGRNLTLTSEQDSVSYDAKQKSASAGGSISVTGGNAAVTLSQEKMHSNWQAVQEQTGIFAGAGGFDVTVGEHTQLNGAVIGSTATADKNKLDTGTLGFSDIENRADYSVEQQSAGISTGGSIAGQFAGNMANSLLVGTNSSDSASSTTKAAVSEGTITIRDQDKQTQDVANLSRDVENANPGLAEIFDKEKEQQRLKEAQLIGEIGSQVSDIARTEGAIAATKAANEKMKDVTPEQLKTAESDWRKANPGKEPTADDISSQAYQTFYNQAFTESGFGTGGKVQQAIQAATAAVQGLAGGDIAKAIAGGSAPYIASVIGSSGLDDASKVLAHAAVNAALAAAQGNNALVGAAGAATAEMAGMIALNAYGKPVSELSETEKQTVSALATLAAGLAGGLTGDSTADAVAAAQAGKTTVENNYLSSKQIDAWSAEMKQCQAGGGDCGGIITKYEELSTAQQKQLISDCATSPATCQQKYGDVLADSMAVKQALDKALGENIPIKMVYDLTATWAHQMDADGIVASNKVSEQIMAKYGLDQAQADIIAGVALSALGGVSKVGKGSGSSANSTAKPSINQGQQNKHVPGTNEYKIASEAGLNKSVLTVQPDSLLSKLGTGQQVGNTAIGTPGSKERINYGKVIGNYIDPQTGLSTPTTNGIVHYGKNGVHIVPARPLE